MLKMNKKLIFFRIKWIFICSLFFSSSILSRTDINLSSNDKDKKIEPPKIGIFSMPITQQPGPFISFGQNVIDQGDLQFLFLADKFTGQNKQVVHLLPSLLYGLTENVSVLASGLYIPVQREAGLHSSGWGDSLLQFEYSFHQKDTYKYAELGTAVVGFVFPTGSSHKVPSTGNGSPQFFVGTTLNRTYMDWYIFISPGTVQTTTNSDGRKFGNLYLYQGGLGKTLYVIDTKLLISALLEIDGTYTEKDKQFGIPDPNSGGNTIYLTPSIWISGKHLSVQFGVGFPIVQRLNGIQLKNYHLIAGSIAWVF